MLPEFDENGNLPPGIHRATMGEIRDRFGIGSLEREVEIKELVEFIIWVRDCGMLRAIVDGSFTTSKENPNDVDIVVLLPSNYSSTPIRKTVAAIWPFIHIQIARDESDLMEWATSDFGVDRTGVIRGVVEVVL